MAGHPLGPQHLDDMAHGALMVADGLATRQRAGKERFDARQRVKCNRAVGVAEKNRRGIVERSSQVQPLPPEDPPPKPIRSALSWFPAITTTRMPQSTTRRDSTSSSSATASAGGTELS